MIVAVSAWSGWDDPAFIRADLDRWMAERVMFGPVGVPLTIRVGGEPDGGDAVVREYCAGLDGVTLAVYAADFTRDGNSAKAYRNRRMLEGSDTWDDTSGTPAALLIAYPQPGIALPFKRSNVWNCITQAHYRRVAVRIPAYVESAPVRRAKADELYGVAEVGAS